MRTVFDGIRTTDPQQLTTDEDLTFLKDPRSTAWFILGRRTGMSAKIKILAVLSLGLAGWTTFADPTFSDANWISMGGILGTSRFVDAAAVDGSGNLYIGGGFTIVGDVFANRVAKWNGSSWTAL